MAELFRLVKLFGMVAAVKMAVIDSLVLGLHWFTTFHEGKV